MPKRREPPMPSASTITSASSPRRALSPPPAKRAKMGGSLSIPDAAAAPAPAPQRASGGPVLTVANATSVMSAYIGSLRNNLAEHNAVYICDAANNADGVAGGNGGGGFTCKVTLPFNSPVPEANSSGAFRSKQLAKQSAAFNAAELLMAAGEIAPTLVPTPASPTSKRRASSPQEARGSTTASTPRDDRVGTAPPPTTGEGRSVVVSGSKTSAAPTYRPADPRDAARDAARQLLPKSTAGAGGVMGEDEYPYLAGPAFWSESPRISAPPLDGGDASATTPLCAAIVTLKFFPPQANMHEQCRALLFLTSRPLPMTHKVLELDVSQQATQARAVFTSVPPLHFSAAQIDQAFEYTRCYMRALLNKPLDGRLEDTAYLVLPLQSDFPRNGKARACAIGDIAWNDIARIEQPLTQPFDLENSDVFAAQLEDCVITPPMELGRRFYATRLRTDLSPGSPCPDAPDQSLFDLAMSREHFEYRYRQVTSLEFPHQPIIEGEHAVGPKSGGLVAALAQRHKQMGKLLIPELLGRHFLPASVLRTGTVLPAALAALDDELIAAELSTRFFGSAVDRELAREALTCPAARPFPGQANYERLEMLGDTVLKLAATTAVYLDAERKSEGAMTRDRHMIVSNRALQAAAIESSVVPYVRSTYRRARDFVPPGWVIDGALDLGNSHLQKLGDKTVADVAEALIAAAYLSAKGNMQAVINACHALHIPVELDSWADLRARPVQNSSGRPLTLLGYKFKDGDRGRVAISLYPMAQRKVQFERYEFLGDAVIDYLTLESFWGANKNLGPAPLTHMKHSRVANSAFAAFMVASGLCDELMDVDRTTTAKLAQFKTDMRRAQAKADAAIAKGKAQHEYWVSVPDYKFLGDIVEALFGAILEDSDFDLGAAARVYNEHLGPFVAKYAVGPHAHSLHPKSALLELFAARGCHQWTIEKGTAVDGGPRSRAPSAAPSGGAPSPGVHLNGHANGHGHGHANGHANGHGKANGNGVGMNAPAPAYTASVLVHGTEYVAEAASPQLAVRNACESALEALRADEGCACKSASRRGMSRSKSMSVVTGAGVGEAGVAGEV